MLPLNGYAIAAATIAEASKVFLLFYSPTMAEILPAVATDAPSIDIIGLGLKTAW